MTGPIDQSVQLRVHASKRDDITAIHVIGDIDVATATALAERTRALLAGTNGPFVILDLTGVTFLGSAGLAVLIELQSRCGRPVRIVADGIGRRAIEITGLHEKLDLYAALDAALAPN